MDPPQETRKETKNETEVKKQKYRIPPLKSRPMGKYTGSVYYRRKKKKLSKVELNPSPFQLAPDT